MKYSRKRKNKRKNKKTKKCGGSRKYVNRSYFSFKKNGVPPQYKENFTRYKNIIEKVGLLVDRKPYELWKYYLSKIEFHKLPKIPEEIFKLPAPLRSTASRYWNRNKKIYSKYQNNAPTPVASKWTGIVPRMLGIENEKRMPLVSSTLPHNLRVSTCIKKVSLICIRTRIKLLQFTLSILLLFTINFFISIPIPTSSTT